MEYDKVGDMRDHRWRLLIFTSECLLDGYGSSSALRTFVHAALKHTQWDLTLITPGAPIAEHVRQFPDVRFVGVPTVSSKYRRTQVLGYTALASLRSALTGQPDIVISWQPTPSAMPGRLAARFTHAAHVVRTCGPELARQWSRFPLITSMSRPVTRRLLATADAVVIKSPLERRLLNDSVRDDRVRLIPNAVDSGVFVPLSTNAHATRFLSAGQLETHKSVEQLISAFVTATGHTSGEYSLTIVGDGTQRAHLERIARGTRADINLVGRVPHSDMPGVYARHDALILSSPLEASSNTCLEAMAAGLPVIGTRKALSDLVRDGVNGILAETDEASHLAMAVDRFLATKVPLAALRAAARRTAERHHPERLIHSYSQLFAELRKHGPR